MKKFVIKAVTLAIILLFTAPLVSSGLAANAVGSAAIAAIFITHDAEHVIIAYPQESNVSVQIYQIAGTGPNIRPILVGIKQLELGNYGATHVSIQASDDIKTIALLDLDGKRLFIFRQGKSEYYLKNTIENIESFALSPDGEIVVLYLTNNTLLLMNVTSLTTSNVSLPSGVIPADTSQAVAAFSSNGTYVLIVALRSTGVPRFIVLRRSGDELTYVSSTELSLALKPWIACQTNGTAREYAPSIYLGRSAYLFTYSCVDANESKVVAVLSLTNRRESYAIVADGTAGSVAVIENGSLLVIRPDLNKTIPFTWSLIEIKGDELAELINYAKKEQFIDKWFVLAYKFHEQLPNSEELEHLYNFMKNKLLTNLITQDGVVRLPFPVNKTIVDNVSRKFSERMEDARKWIESKLSPIDDVIKSMAKACEIQGLEVFSRQVNSINNYLEQSRVFQEINPQEAYEYIEQANESLSDLEAGLTYYLRITGIQELISCTNNIQSKIMMLNNNLTTYENIVNNMLKLLTQNTENLNVILGDIRDLSQKLSIANSSINRIKNDLISIQNTPGSINFTKLNSAVDNIEIIKNQVRDIENQVRDCEKRLSTEVLFRVNDIESLINNELKQRVDRYINNLKSYNNTIERLLTLYSKILDSLSNLTTDHERILKLLKELSVNITSAINELNKLININLTKTLSDIYRCVSEPQINFNNLNDLLVKIIRIRDYINNNVPDIVDRYRNDLSITLKDQIKEVLKPYVAQLEIKTRKLISKLAMYQSIVNKLLELINDTGYLGDQQDSLENLIRKISSEVNRLDNVLTELNKTGNTLSKLLKIPAADMSINEFDTSLTSIESVMNNLSGVDITAYKNSVSEALNKSIQQLKIKAENLRESAASKVSELQRYDRVIQILLNLVRTHYDLPVVRNLTEYEGDLKGLHENITQKIRELNSSSGNLDNYINELNNVDVSSPSNETVEKIYSIGKGIKKEEDSIQSVNTERFKDRIEEITNSVCSKEKCVSIGTILRDWVKKISKDASEPVTGFFPGIKFSVGESLRTRVSNLNKSVVALIQQKDLDSVTLAGLLDLDAETLDDIIYIISGGPDNLLYLESRVTDEISSLSSQANIASAAATALLAVVIMISGRIAVMRYKKWAEDKPRRELIKEAKRKIADLRKELSTIKHLAGVPKSIVRAVAKKVDEIEADIDQAERQLRRAYTLEDAEAVYQSLIKIEDKIRDIEEFKERYKRICEHGRRVYTGGLYVGTTDIGERVRNEDKYATEIIGGCVPLLAVADGVGGTKAGNVASEAAVNALVAFLEDKFAKDPVSFVNEPGEVMRKAIKEANRAVLRFREKFGNAATTLTAALIIDDERVVIGHVGDSRAYLVKPVPGYGRAILLTKDDTLIQQLLAEGKITEEEAKTHPQRHVLLKALGSAEEISPQIIEVRGSRYVPQEEHIKTSRIGDKSIRIYVETKAQEITPTSGARYIDEKLEAGDIILLCTDGLTDTLSDNDIFTIISKILGTEGSINKETLKKVAKYLILNARHKGSDDNITVVLYFHPR